MGQVEKPVFLVDSSYSRMEFQKRLRLRDVDLPSLIPPRLYELVPDPMKVEVLRLDQELGGIGHPFWEFSNGFYPVLSVLVVERGGLEVPTEEQELQNSKWGQVLNGRRLHVLDRGLISQSDKVLFSLIADTWNKYGVDVVNYVEAESLRRKGLGSSFYNNFEQIIERMGYKYIFGTNEHENIGFFLKTGRYSLDQLDQDKVKAYHLVCYDSSALKTIKFFDREFESKFVRPEFLRSSDE